MNVSNAVVQFDVRPMIGYHLTMEGLGLYDSFVFVFQFALKPPNLSRESQSLFSPVVWRCRKPKRRRECHEQKWPP